ncbi:Cysteine-rich membrane protein 2 [Spironucleus salmonicida]|uniref:Cysteine-rich membrane protein 2 n=1 Tax=Spironucleus salmonicida TaxID=348837 RepID=A0A9P8LY11_9EUKA|nr:Cysteine-rich membrane protein 2 [Spironucleus salmonicida]
MSKCSSPTDHIACPEKFYCPSDASQAEQKDCLPCNKSCEQCNGPDANNCLTCPTGQYLTGDQTCAACDVKCAACRGSPTICQACANSHELINQACSTCVLSRTKNCTCGTSINCATCKDSDQTVCGLCSKKYDLNTEKPCTVCRAGYIETTIDRVKTCVKCDAPCTSCSAEDVCTACKDGYVLTNSTCTVCQENITENCICGSAKNCSTCDLTDIAKCGSCSGNFQLSDSKICETCKPGYFASNTSPLTCEKCPITCLTCTNAATCQTCQNGNFLLNSVCIPCVAGQAQQCTCGVAKNCDICDTNNAANCASCIGDFDISGSDPCTVCKTGFYANLASPKTCSKCAQGCAICASANDCNTCENDYSMLGTTCEKCKSGQSGPCQCESFNNCTTCDLNTKKCSSCITNYDVNSDPPCSSCVSGMFPDTQNSCKKCVANCLKCASLSSCTSCDAGYAIEGGACSKCPANCKTCTSANSCETCESGFHLVSLQCVRDCTEQTDCAGNQICDSTCKDCAEGCASCEVSIGNCKSCDSGYKLNGQKCEACAAGCAICDGEACMACKNGYYMLNGVCTNCSGNDGAECVCGAERKCATCDNGDSSKCGSCVVGYAKGESGKCDSCADGYIMVNLACVKCDLKCKTCSRGAEICDSCADSYHMTTNQTCEADCGAGSVDGMVCVGGTSIPCGGVGQSSECKCQNSKNCFTCSEDKSKCKQCLSGYMLEQELCNKCEDGAVSIGGFCFVEQVSPAQSLSGGAITGIVITVLIIIGAICFGIFWYMKKVKITKPLVESGVAIQ